MPNRRRASCPAKQLFVLSRLCYRDARQKQKDLRGQRESGDFAVARADADENREFELKYFPSQENSTNSLVRLSFLLLIRIYINVFLLYPDIVFFLSVVEHCGSRKPSRASRV